MQARKVAIGPFDCYSQGKNLLGDQYMTFVGITFVGLFISGLIPLILIGPMYAGMALCLLMQASRRRFDFNTLFKGFDYFGPTLIVHLLTMVITFVAMIPIFIFGFGGMMLMGLGEQNAVFILLAIPVLGIAFICYMLLIFCIFPITFFATILVVEKRMDPMASVKAAMDGVMKNLMGIIGLGFVGSLFMSLGIMLCCIGVYFVIPIYFAANFVAYQKIFGASSLPTSPTGQLGKPPGTFQQQRQAAGGYQQQQQQRPRNPYGN